MYQIYKSGEKYGTAHAGRAFMEAAVERLKKEYPREAWSLEGPGMYGEYRGRAAELETGRKYKTTWSNGRNVTLVSVYNISDDGNGNCDVILNGTMYIASTLQLYNV